MESPTSPGTQKKISSWIAGAICVVAIALAVLIAMRVPQYEAQARLAYNPAGAPAANPASSTLAPSVIKGSATTAALSAVTDAELAQVVDRYDLYPELRHNHSTASLTNRLRDHLVFTEPAADVLQLAFRDADQSKAASVANRVASVLASYQVMLSVPMAQPDLPSTTKHQAKGTKLRGYEGHSTPPPVVLAPAPVVLSAAPPIASNAEYIAELMRQVDRVNAALTYMQSAHAELETEQKQVEAKIDALEKTERKAAEGRVAAKPDAARSERAVIEQDLTVEKAQLASLRERYTDAYPDVQSTQDDITKLQAKLAALPPAPVAGDKVSPTPDQIEAMDKLHVEKLRVDRDLSQNEASVAGETQRKMSLLARVEQAKTRRGNPSAAVATSAPAPLVTPGTQTVTEESQPSMMSIPVLPFRVVQPAGSAALVTASRMTLDLWLGGGTLVLLALCFVPMVPAHFAAVVTTPDELQEAMPEHVVYLGDVGRLEH